MSGAPRSWVWAVLFVALWQTLACDRPTGFKKSSSAAPSGSGQKLDGMQFSSARRVALESAIDAMKRRDLARLKQLSIWVRGRAQVAIFEPDDLTALDLAIQCLEQVSPPSDALQTLDALGSGQLRKAARGVCAGNPEK